jgi:CheY-like chemotaxis protein
MDKSINSIDILMAEDDVEDQMLVQDAFRAARLANRLCIVSDGEELMRFLLDRADGPSSELPGVILLDLNMPRKDGREALREIRAHPRLRRIPVVVLTTSSAEEDILTSYDLGVSTYVRKPVTFEKFVEVVRTLGTYWFEVAELPRRAEGC